VFDGAGAPLAEADVAVEGGRILEVGTGLVMVDGDPFEFAGLPGAVREVWKDGARVRPWQPYLASA